jgi:deoxyribodipyrimidine photo-lyase
VLDAAGVEVGVFDAGTLFRPAAITNRSGKPYRVFTAFWKHCLSQEPPSPPLPQPKSLTPPAAWPVSEALEVLELLPRDPDWAVGIRSRWRPGTQAAEQRLADFIEHRLHGYTAGRDRPADDAVSGLSASLHFGEIGAREVWHAVRTHQAAARSARFSEAADAFLRQLGWREFACHLLHHFPACVTEPMVPAFRNFPWRKDTVALRAWQTGQTGFPFVDAGMRELWHTGYMHNRVRMVVASFLVKDLLLHWLHGARWFWDTLVDADLANNTMGWQWSAGSGVDAAPYFRVFNPVRQGERFDPDGHYIRRWLPELAGLPVRDLHAPWRASQATLRQAGVRLGETYPQPVVDHDAARKRALAALERMRATGD